MCAEKFMYVWKELAANKMNEGLMPRFMKNQAHGAPSTLGSNIDGLGWAP